MYLYYPQDVAVIVRRRVHGDLDNMRSCTSPQLQLHEPVLPVERHSEQAVVIA